MIKIPLPLTTVWPVSVLAPERVSVPAPLLVKPPPLLITPEIVRLWLVLVVMVRVALRIMARLMVSVSAADAAVVAMLPPRVIRLPERVKFDVWPADPLLVRLMPMKLVSAVMLLFVIGVVVPPNWSKSPAAGVPDTQLAADQSPAPPAAPFQVRVAAEA